MPETTTTKENEMTMTETSNAAHMPRNFDPMAYEFVDGFDSAAGYPPGTPAAEERYVLRRLLATSPSSRYDERAACDHCGAAIRYVVVVRHIETGDHVAIGETCASDRIGSMDRATWKLAELRKAAQAARAAERTKAGRRANLDAAADLVQWIADHAGRWIPRTMFDLRRAHENGATWTAEDIEAGRKAAAEYDAEDARRAAEKAARDANKRPAPEGRHEVIGTVSKVKATEGYMGGTTWKMTVWAEAGFGVWTSVPAAIQDAYSRSGASSYYGADGNFAEGFQTFEAWLTGRRVRFTATLERSDRDETFAFAKRPTKAEVL